MKILMGIDDSKFAETLMHRVVAQFRTENAEILVLHVLEPVEPVAPPKMAKGYAPELEDQKKPAFTLLERIGNELRKAGFNVQAAAKIGDVRETIIETAVKWHADIILVGSHGRRGIQSFLWGAWRNLSLAMQNAP